MKYLFILLLLFALPVQADKVILGAVSHHFNYPVQLRESHPAIGIERDGWEVSYFKNSLDKNSLAVARIHRVRLYKHISHGSRFGIATNYPTTTRIGKDGRSYTMDALPLNLQFQAQYLLSYSSDLITVDLGIGPVASLVFKLQL